jgi:hypothetical protein
LSKIPNANNLKRGEDGAQPEPVDKEVFLKKTAFLMATGKCYQVQLS